MKLKKAVRWNLAMRWWTPSSEYYGQRSSVVLWSDNILALESKAVMDEVKSLVVISSNGCPGVSDPYCWQLASTREAVVQITSMVIDWFQARLDGYDHKHSEKMEMYAPVSRVHIHSWVQLFHLYAGGLREAQTDWYRPWLLSPMLSSCTLAICFTQ